MASPPALPPSALPAWLKVQHALRQALRLGNSLRLRLAAVCEPITVFVEPWCEEVTLAAGSTMDLVIEYRKPQRLEIELTDELFIVHAWGGCRAKLFVDGIRTASRSMRLRFPDIAFTLPPDQR